MMKPANIVRELYRNMSYAKSVWDIKRSKDSSQKPHIVFLVQLMQIWGKTERVYLEAVQDPDVKVTLLVLPEQMEDAGRQEDGFQSNYQKLKKYGDSVVNAVKDHGELVQLKDLKPDYVFYPRPYDDYLPETYRSYQVRRYAKVCYIPYGFLLTDTCTQTCMNKSFFRYCYYYFAESPCHEKYNKNRFRISHLCGLRKSVFFGFPAFAGMKEAKEQKSSSWEQFSNKDTFHLIWTPRWTTDSREGGSNFFHYKDSFIQFARENQDVSLVYRPHPLTFRNFIRTGEMTQEQLDQFRAIYEEEENLYIEEKPDYYDTFWGSDVLITDCSSVDIEYFITGKPVIYCYRDSVKFNEFADQLYSGAYQAGTWQEVEKYVLDLKNGIDPLKEKRQQLVEKLLGTDFEKISAQIVKEIKKDYKK